MASCAPVGVFGAALAGSAQRRVRPADAAWPDAAAWQQLRRQLNGELIAVQPLFAPCGAAAGGAACSDLQQHLRNPFYLGDQAGGTQVSGWAGAWRPAPSVYAIAARNAADVAAGVNFARDKQLRLVVKATGHSYQGTSNAADSLMIWTRAMNQVTLHEQFVPRGCEASMAPVAAVSAGAGAVWIDLYHAVTTVGGRYVQGGGCADVGVAGLIQSGGFGSFSKGYGSASAHLLEAEVVTADGAIVIANAGTNPDLFWALKGGGGGSWGVVTRVTLRTHALPAYFGAAWGKVKADSDDAYRRLIGQFVDFYAGHLCNPHWGEQVSLAPDNTLTISMVCQGLDGQQAARIWAPFFAALRATPGLTVTAPLGAREGPSRDWWKVEGNDAMIADDRAGAPRHHGWWRGDQAQVGVFLTGFDSLWMPATLLAPPQRDQLADALMRSSRHKQVQLHFNKGLAGAGAEALAAAADSAIHPAALSAFALVIIADAQRPAYPGQAEPDLAAARQSASAIAAAAQELHRLVPDAGSYVSESDYFNPRWQQAFWGSNHARLSAIKQRVDPDGLFFVHHGVGSEAWSADGFTRQPRPI